MHLERTLDPLPVAGLYSARGLGVQRFELSVQCRPPERLGARVDFDADTRIALG